MYRLFLVEDEPWALREIEHIVDWQALGFEHVHAFQDPVAALEAIRTEKPDVVLTDIRMPDMTGHQLIEKSREFGSEAYFVIVSAYADFDYARRALEEGVFSYLLKPLDENEVETLAGKLIARLNERERQREQQRVRNLVSGILLGRREESAEAADAPFRVAISGTPGDGWTGIYSDLYLKILTADELPEHGGVSEPGCRYSHLIREALTAYYTLHFFGSDSRVLCYRKKQDFYPQAQEMLAAIREGDVPHALSLLESVRSLTAGSVMLDQLSFFYNEILTAVLDKIHDRDLSENLRRFSGCFDMYAVLHDFRTYCDSLTVLIGSCAAKHTPVRTDVMENVVSYVDKHYCEALTLEGLSGMFNISLSHLCRRFKQMTGKSFTEYLSDKRIARAVELLVHTEKTVAEIGEATGYLDYFYFSKVFKKKMGITPSAYRRREDTVE